MYALIEKDGVTYLVFAGEYEAELFNNTEYNGELEQVCFNDFLNALILAE